jgi:hypothetical protein
MTGLPPDQAARAPVFEGLMQLNGYTEPLLYRFCAPIKHRETL